MNRQSKRTLAPAPAPALAPSPSPQPVVPPLGGQAVVPPAIHSMFPPGGWCPPGSLQQPAPSALNWYNTLQQIGLAGSSSAQDPWCGPADVQAWGVDSHPPGGFVNFLKKNTPNSEQDGSKESSSQPINICEDTNNDSRTEKRLTWTKEEDLVLIGVWLNNSKDPIQSNYKKNDQYWKSVTTAYNSAIPKSRARQLKQVKDRFGRIKKRVAWFCASWKEANALWASGGSDVNLMDKALKLYEDEHKQDGPFMFKHCWEVLCKEPKWDAYLERLEDLEPEKRKFEEDVGEHFTLDDAVNERPIGGKKAKAMLKWKRKDQACIIDIEDELQAFVDAQNKANDGRKEMLETQKRVSSENLEARKLAYLAAKETKESGMLETYRELLKQDTTKMAEDVRAGHVLTLKCLREKLFSN